jgi:hypothetical protein
MPSTSSHRPGLNMQKFEKHVLSEKSITLPSPNAVAPA